MKAAHNKQHQQLEFAVSDWAWFRLNQHAAVSVRDSPLSKLAPKYFGPYQVIERLGPVTYRLQLPPHARIHDVFHVAFLKRFDGAAPTAIAPLPPIVCGRTVLMPQEVVHAKPTANSWELLVKWQGRTAAEASWEQLDAFKEPTRTSSLRTSCFARRGEMLWIHTSRDSIAGGRREQEEGSHSSGWAQEWLSVGLIVIPALSRFIVILALG
jgi:hypothetical protein